MSKEMFVVNEDSTIGVMHDLPDSEIVNMVGSDYFPAVFRLSTYGVEYAEVDLSDGTIEWKTAVNQEE